MRAPRANTLPVLLALLALVALLALISVAQAQSEVVVLLLSGRTEQPEAELTARIRGQTRDMPLSLKVESRSAPITRESAGESAHSADAQIVVWTEPTGPAGLRLHLLDVESGELRTRSVSTSQRETLASSTTAEMAALVVRSELSALLAERAARDAPPPPAPSAPPPVTPEPVAPKPASPAAAPELHAWWLALGYRPSLPIQDELAHGFAGAGRYERGKLVLGLTGHLALPISLSDPDAQLRLLRGGLRAEALRALQLAPALRLMLGGAAGLTLTGRTTESAQLPLQSEASAVTAGATLGLLTELHWLWFERTGLWLGAGVDGVLWRTKFAYELPEGTHQQGSLAKFEPWLILGFFARLSPARAREGALRRSAEKGP